jgi:hypothetical protein
VSGSGIEVELLTGEDILEIMALKGVCKSFNAKGAEFF